MPESPCRNRQPSPSRTRSVLRPERVVGCRSGFGPCGAVGAVAARRAASRRRDGLSESNPVAHTLRRRRRGRRAILVAGRRAGGEPAVEGRWQGERCLSRGRARTRSRLAGGRYAAAFDRRLRQTLAAGRGLSLSAGDMAKLVTGETSTGRKQRDLVWLRGRMARWEAARLRHPNNRKGRTLRRRMARGQAARARGRDET